MLVGVDISHHNGSIMDKLKQVITFPIHFVICKATEGTSFVDTRFDANMDNAEDMGLLRGAYHYVNSKDVHNADAAMKEAEHFVRRVRPYGDALLALDFEEKSMLSQDGVDYLTLVASRVKNLTGTPPLIYVSESVVKQFDFSGCVKVGCGLWVAKWMKNRVPELNDGIQENEYAKAVSGEFGITAIQQISDICNIHGITYNLDVDIANMSVEAWEKYANPRLY